MLQPEASRPTQALIIIIIQRGKGKATHIKPASRFSALYTSLG
jgi:hypothetical protein